MNPLIPLLVKFFTKVNHKVRQLGPTFIKVEAQTKKAKPITI